MVALRTLYVSHTFDKECFLLMLSDLSGKVMSEYGSNINDCEAGALSVTVVASDTVHLHHVQCDEDTSWICRHRALPIVRRPAYLRVITSRNSSEPERTFTFSKMRDDCLKNSTDLRETQSC